MKRATHIRVLLVSAADEPVAELGAALADATETFELTAVAGTAEAIGALRASRFEVVIVDVDTGGQATLEPFAAIRAAAAETALIALTGSPDEQLAVRTLLCGAEEHLVRHTSDMAPPRLARAIRNAVVRSAGESGRPLPTALDRQTGVSTQTDAGTGDGTGAERGSGPGGDSLAEQQLNYVFAQALIGMAILDAEQHVLRANEALARLLGRSQAELLGASLQDFAHPDFHGDEARVMRLLESTAERHHVRECCFVHADGHVLWAEVAVSLISELDGDPARVIVQVQDITERRAHVERLRHIADHDPLTGLLNRRGFDRELASHLERARRYGATGALLLFDLDNFKSHNDTYGHDAGDELLGSLGRALRSRLRASDPVGRLGGDEFAVLLPDANRARTELVTLALLDQISAVTAQLPAPPQAEITASIGMVCFERTGALPVATVKRYADEAMYAAKRQGRNQYVEWTPAYEPQLLTGTQIPS